MDFFTTSHANMSFLGSIATSHLTFTKSKSEIEPIMSKNSQISNNRNNEPLLRYETDNLHDDSSLLEARFITLLKET